MCVGCKIAVCISIPAHFVRSFSLCFPRSPLSSLSSTNLFLTTLPLSAAEQHVRTTFGNINSSRTDRGSCHSRSSGNELSGAKSQSTATFVTALWINAAVFGVELLAFTILRPKFPVIYEPRVYLLNDE